MDEEKMKSLLYNPTAVAPERFQPILQSDKVLPEQKQELLNALALERNGERNAVQNYLTELQARRNVLAKDIKYQEAKVELIKTALTPLSNDHDLILEQNECSRLHKLVDAFRSEQVFSIEDLYVNSQFTPHIDDFITSAHPFVVTHNWALAFSEALTGFEQDFNLPYPHCAFEFRINGRTVIARALQVDAEAGDAEIGITVFVHGGGNLGWWGCSDDAAHRPLLEYVWMQIKAISIALDASVATQDVVPAPQALNKKIQKAQRCPVYEYRVVNLAKRYRNQRSDAEPTGRRTRLHFRRGHWRHFEDHKTWINWMLVGDPSLGFIDKEYKL